MGWAAPRSEGGRRRVSGGENGKHGESIWWAGPLVGLRELYVIFGVLHFLFLFLFFCRTVADKQFLHIITGLAFHVSIQGLDKAFIYSKKIS